MTGISWSDLGGDVLDDLFEGGEAVLDFGERYEVLSVLGQGGQGTVYRALDTRFQREVAIKLGDGRRDDLVEAEGALLSRLAHPAIPAVYDTGKAADGRRFVVMQLIEGVNLDAFLSAQKPKLPQRLRIFRAIGGAVAHAHRRGLYHRDLKPSNVLVSDDGEAYLVDWGLAATGDRRAVCGSPMFASPEQLEGQVADGRADVYSLGVLLYVILSGEVPYARRVNDFQEFRRHRAGLGRVPLRRRCPDLSPRLQSMCETAMAAQAGARYADPQAMLDDLTHYESGQRLARELPGIAWGKLTIAGAALMLMVIAFILGRTLGGVTDTPEVPQPVSESSIDAPFDVPFLIPNVPIYGPVPSADQEPSPSATALKIEDAAPARIEDTEIAEEPSELVQANRGNDLSDLSNQETVHAEEIPGVAHLTAGREAETTLSSTALGLPGLDELLP